MVRGTHESRRTLWRTVAVGLMLSLAAAAFATVRSTACPFCTAVALTLTQEMDSADLAVIVRLKNDQPPPDSDVIELSPPATKSKFEIVDVLKGGDFVKPGQTIELLYFGQDAEQPEFLVTAVDPKEPSWATPIGLSERAGAYVRKLPSLPAKGGDRLAFFQDHLEDEDPLMAGDAYDEFAKAPYAEVQELGPRMHHDKLMGWIQDPEVTPSRKRLYLTMLGICGTKEDVPTLVAMITSDDRQTRSALDAIVACYLLLEGPDGLPLVENLYLKNQEAEYTDTYAVIMALRFHGQELEVIPRQRLVEALRHMLDRPQLADLVIADLARWQDWDSAPRLVELFKNANEESGWVRVPVVNFLRACPLPESKAYLAELEEIDPDAVKRANNFLPLPGGGNPPPAPAPTPSDSIVSDKPADDASDEQDAVGDLAAAQAPATTDAADETSEDAPTPPDDSTTPEEDSDPAANAATTESEGAAEQAPGSAETKTESNDEAMDVAAAAVAATAPSDGGTSPPAELRTWLIFVVPIVVAAFLVFLLLFIFRGGRSRVTA